MKKLCSITITVINNEDTLFLNKRGLAYFWNKINTKKQNKLTAGSNITINGDTINASQPTVNNGQLTIQKNGSTVATFTANSSTSTTANITVPIVDTARSSTSTKAVQNKVIYEAIGDVESVLQKLNNGSGAA